MKSMILILLILGFSPISKILGQGLEIYLVKHSYPDFTKMKKSDTCLYCFSPKKADLIDSALIKESDIEYFDWDKQILCLKENAAQKIRKLDIPLQGLAVAMTLDKEPIYGFWLWNLVSSFGCDWISSFVYPNSNNLMLVFGLPKGNSKGSDPRLNKKLKKYLIDNKITGHNNGEQP